MIIKALNSLLVGEKLLQVASSGGTTHHLGASVLYILPLLP